MPRRLSWLAQLPRILKSVQNTPRSHFDRKRFETLFALKTRAAQELIELLADQTIGRSNLVSRETLLLFLHRVEQQPHTNLSDLAESIRVAPNRQLHKTKRLPRTLIATDVPLSEPISLPDTIQLTRGHLQIHFDTTQQLAQNLYLLSKLIETDTFSQTCETQTQNTHDDEERNDVRAMFDELQMLEAKYKQRHKRGEVSP